MDSSKVLFVAVDVRQMWLTLDLRVEDAKLVVLGQEVRFRPDGSQEAREKSPGSARRPITRPAR